MPPVKPAKPAAPVLTIEAAREILKNRGLIGSVSPSKLLASARELQLSFDETLKYLSEVLSGGQGQGPFPETKEALAAAAGK